MTAVREAFDTLSLAVPLRGRSRLQEGLDRYGVEEASARPDPAKHLRPDLTWDDSWKSGQQVLPGTQVVDQLTGEVLDEGVSIVDVDARRRADGSEGFDTAQLPVGVGWRTLHTPGRARPFVGAAIPAAKRYSRDGPVERRCSKHWRAKASELADCDACERPYRKGELRKDGTTGVEGLSIIIGPWGQDDVEYAQVQVSSKALHDGSNVHAMSGQTDVGQVLDLVEPHLRCLGFRGNLWDAYLQRLDSVVDFSGVESHQRYVRAFSGNKVPRGMRTVAHGGETLAVHGRSAMSRFYDKHAESKVAEAIGRSRFEWERRRSRLTDVGMATVRDLDLARLDAEARRMFENLGYDREVSPMSDWAYKVLSCVPVDHETGEPLRGFGPSVRRAAIAHALLVRAGLGDFGASPRSVYTYNRLFAEAGVALEDVCLTEPEGGEVLWLDLHSQEERRRPGRAS